MFTDRRLPISYVWMLSLQALILCSFANYAHSEYLDIELCNVVISELPTQTNSDSSVQRPITTGICNLLALRDLAERADDDVKGCDTLELLDQNVNDACKSLSMPNLDECKKDLRDYCINRRKQQKLLKNTCNDITQLGIQI